VALSGFAAKENAQLYLAITRANYSFTDSIGSGVAVPTLDQCPQISLGALSPDCDKALPTTLSTGSVSPKLTAGVDASLTCNEVLLETIS
jgi:hypothetical protein